PDYRKHSLGKYLLLLKTEYAREQQLAYYYPGYLVYGYSKFDYKLFASPEATELVRTTSENPDFRTLVQLLDQDLAARDGAEHGFYAQYNTIAQLNHVVVAYLGGKPV
nr:hypothetical protein [Tanacetum cinerariifolium]